MSFDIYCNRILSYKYKTKILFANSKGLNMKVHWTQIGRASALVEAISLADASPLQAGDNGVKPPKPLWILLSFVCGVELRWTPRMEEIPTVLQCNKLGRVKIMSEEVVGKHLKPLCH